MPSAEITAFWSRTRDELDKEPMRAEVTPAPEQSAREYDTWRVILYSFGGRKIRAWFSVPKDAPPGRRFPAIVDIPGYAGDKPIHAMLLELGYAVLTLYPRGQGESKAEWELESGTKLTYRIEDKEQYYYRGCYMDLVRGVDFLVAKPEVDSERIAVWGRSQGGGLTLALAALDHRVAAAVGEQPFLSNLPLAAQLTSRPYAELHDYIEQRPDQREALLANLAYFDPMNLADAVQCPTLVNCGMKDQVVPYDTVLPTFANLQCLKSFIVYPDLDHNTCSDFNVQAINWLKRYVG